LLLKQEESTTSLTRNEGLPLSVDPVEEVRHLLSHSGLILLSASGNQETEASAELLAEALLESCMAS